MSWAILALTLIILYNSAKNVRRPLVLLPIETDRLLLRLWRHSDAEDLYEYAQNPLVGPSAGWAPHTSLGVSQKIIQSFMDDQDVYAIVLKSSGKVIGSVSIHEKYPDEDLKHLRQREIGYVLNPDYWGNGYMPEAVAAVRDYCLNDLDLDLLWCGHFQGNYKSKRVIEKTGFTYRFTKETVLPRMNNRREQTLFYAIKK